MTYSSLLAQSPFLRGCIEAGARLSLMLAKREEANFVRHSKGAGGDISIGADLLCEAEFGKELLGLASFDSEEGGFIQCNGEGSDIIVLDPLDGSDNYLSNIPYYGASLALCDKNGSVKEACIINFCSGEVFYDRLDFGVDFARESSLNTSSNSSDATYNKDGNKQSKQDEVFPRYTKLHLFRKEILKSTYCIESNAKSMLSQMPQTLAQARPKCGIFERAYCNPTVVAKLHNHNIKFRSLGAGALSLVYALESRFLLLGGKSRHYDAKAGQFLARDLHIGEIVDKNGAFFLLVSKYKEVFDMISKILLDSK